MVTPIQEIHENDSGLSFIVTVMDADGVVDLSLAGVLEFHFQKPDGSMLISPAFFVNDGVDGQVYHDTSPTDFDQPGIWRHQVYAEIGPDQKYSNITKFRVYPNLPLAL